MYEVIKHDFFGSILYYSSNVISKFLLTLSSSLISITYDIDFLREDDLVVAGDVFSQIYS